MIDDKKNNHTGCVTHPHLYWCFQHESSYILDAEFSKGAMLEFISSYTDGILNRSLRSSSALPRGVENHYPVQDVEGCQRRGAVCVQELNSDSFHHIVLAQNVVSTENFNTFTAIVDLSRFNNSCLKMPVSTSVDLIFQSHSFSLIQLTYHYR
jgi:hypothetical protein